MVARCGGHWGSRGRAPCAAPLYLLFRALDRAALDAALGRWGEGVLAATPAPAGEVEGLAGDGKAVRGSRTQGVPRRGRTCSPSSANAWG